MNSKPTDLEDKAEELAGLLAGASAGFASLGVHVGRTFTRYRPADDAWELVVVVGRDGVDGDRECTLNATGAATSVGDFFHYGLVVWWGGEWSLADFRALPLHDPSARDAPLS